MTDEREEQVKQMFLTGVNLQRTLASFCSDACGATDPIVQTVLSVLASPVQLQLTRVGLQMFQGKDLTLPFYRMEPAQRAFLTEAMGDAARWTAHENSLLWKRRGERVRLDAADVLEAICAPILRCKRYNDPKARVAVCNIILQRVQASAPLSPALQMDLNRRLFPEAAI